MEGAIWLILDQEYWSIFIMRSDNINNTKFIFIIYK